MSIPTPDDLPVSGTGTIRGRLMASLFLITWFWNVGEGCIFRGDQRQRWDREDKERRELNAAREQRGTPAAGQSPTGR